MLFLAIPLLLVLVHVNILPGIQPSGTAYYKCYKTIAALYFFVFLGVALLLDEVIRRRPWRGLSGALSIALLASSGVWIASNMFVTIRAAAAIKEVPSIYREGAIRRGLDAAGAGPVLVVASDINSSFWDLITSAFGIRRMMLDEKQARIVYHASSVVLLDAPVVTGVAEGRDKAAPAVLFSGKVIVPQISGYSPGPQGMSTRAVLDAIKPGLRFEERKELFADSAFRVVDGELVSTGNPDAAADGSANMPPSILGLFPNLGNDPEGELDFSYTDPNGYSDITAVLINISSGQPGSSECYMSYGRLAKQLGLVQGGGVAWKTALLGSGKTLENGVCGIDSARSSINGVGTKLTLHLAFWFKRAFRGRKTVYTMVFDEGKLTTGWRSVGGWTVP
jgi:hypothetical protein